MALVDKNTFLQTIKKKKKKTPIRNLSVREMKDRKYSINKTILVFSAD